jgi:predicted amidohydrolase
MKIAAANYPILYHSSLEAWKAHVEGWVQRGREADLLLFPEYGSMELVSLLDAELQADARGQVKAMQVYLDAFQAWYAMLAGKYGRVIVAPSFPILLDDEVINRVFVFSAEGKLAGYQDKLFMTPFEKYDWGVSAGKPQVTVFEADWGSFGIQICYDSEFSLGARFLAEAGAEVLLLPSCTETLRGATRVHVGARARALENQCYTIVSQTIGEAVWTPTVDYNFGYCAAYSTPDLGLPEEGILQMGPRQVEGWLMQDFDTALNQNVREHGGVRNFADHQKIQMNRTDVPLRVERVKC